MNKRKWESTLDKCSNLSKILKTTGAELLKTKENGNLVAAKQALLNTKVVSTVFDLRVATRGIEEELETQASELNEYKKKLEEINSRHNLAVYEKQLHQQELEECNTLKGINAESLGLLPLEAYLTLNKNANPKQKSEHQLLVERLNFELIHRKKLAAKMDELKDKKKKALEAKSASLKQLNATESKLKALQKAADPTFELRPLPRAPLLSHYLSSPLYLLYNQVIAYQEFFDSGVSVEIKGSLHDATSYDPKTTGSTKSKLISLKELCVSHPLQLLVHFYSSPNVQQARTSMLVVEFSYYPLLKFVTARASRGEVPADELLTTLFPGDEGDSIPAATSYLLAEGESFNLANFSKLCGRPYMWAQCICGLSRLDTGFTIDTLKKAQTPLDLAGQSFHTVFNQIKEKLL